MGRKKAPGLFKRGKLWHIDKCIYDRRLRESCGTDSLEEAEHYLARRVEEIRQATVYGVRPKRTFREAATKFLLENQHKRSIQDDALQLRILDPYIGDLPLEAVHMGSLQTFMKERRKKVKTRTVNYGLQVTRHILNLAASEWMDEHGLTWLAHAPKIKLLAQTDTTPAYPLSWAEQKRLFKELPEHLRNMALFAVNTGCRDREICQLQWQWEIKVRELHTSVFIIPKKIVKNKHDRLVVLNKTAWEVIQQVRGRHTTYVFTYHGKPIQRMLRSAWRKARVRAGLAQVRVHDLKHTFGRRLRAAGVNFENRQDLLGHKSCRITTHYSAAELKNLLKAANSVCMGTTSSPVMTLLRTSPHNFPTMRLQES